jgi:hypothetical protein
MGLLANPMRPELLEQIRSMYTECTRCAPVAQMDRAIASGAIGREFEPLRAHHFFACFDFLSLLSEHFNRACLIVNSSLGSPHSNLGSHLLLFALSFQPQGGICSGS